jgi:hypothetical protein
MKTVICLALLWGVTLTETPSKGSIPESEPGLSTETTPFTLVKQENDICIYTRWLPVDENRSARQVKVTFAVDAPASEALSVLLNDASFTSWMKGTSDYHRVHTVDPGNWYSYIQFSIPWPFNDQDCIIHYEIRNHSRTYTEILLNGEPDYLSAVNGVTRISHMEGAWKLVSAGPERTLVEYVIFSNQPSSFPRWITDPIIQNNMIKTMTAFRECVTQNL